MLQAVQTIHDQRIVHSDLKPANFLLVEGTLKLIDFGIASAIQNDATSVMRENQIGTVNYMSPEALIDTAAASNGGSNSGQQLMKVGVLVIRSTAIGLPPFRRLRPRPCPRPCPHARARAHARACARVPD